MSDDNVVWDSDEAPFNDDSVEVDSGNLRRPSREERAAARVVIDSSHATADAAVDCLGFPPEVRRARSLARARPPRERPTTGEKTIPERFRTSSLTHTPTTSRSLTPTRSRSLTGTGSRASSLTRTPSLSSLTLTGPEPPSARAMRAFSRSRASCSRSSSPPPSDNRAAEVISKLNPNLLISLLSEACDAHGDVRALVDSKADEEARKLYIHNLSYDSTPQSVESFFSMFGGVSDVLVQMRLYDTTWRRGYVLFNNSKGARDALVALSPEVYDCHLASKGCNRPCLF